MFDIKILEILSTSACRNLNQTCQRNEKVREERADFLHFWVLCLLVNKANASGEWGASFFSSLIFLLFALHLLQAKLGESLVVSFACLITRLIPHYFRIIWFAYYFRNFYSILISDRECRQGVHDFFPILHSLVY